MELLFIALFGAILGLIGRYTLGNRDSQSDALLPAIGTGTAAVVWVALTWFGLAWDGGWIWLITLVVTAVIVVAANILIGRVRSEADARLLDRLSKAPAAGSPAGRG